MAGARTRILGFGRHYIAPQPRIPTTIPPQTWTHQIRLSSVLRPELSSGSAYNAPGTHTLMQTEPFVHEPAIDLHASRSLTPVTLQSLLCLSPTSLMSNAHYLQRELPVRVAKIVKAMQGLPLIVASNPHISRVKNLYCDFLTEMIRMERVRDDKGMKKFCDLLQDLVGQGTGVIPLLAQGFLECYKYIPQKSINAFINDVITARIGIRVLAEHHIALHAQFHDHGGHWTLPPSIKNGHPGHDLPSSSIMSRSTPETNNIHGIIHSSLRPYSLLMSCASFVTDLCESYLGASAPVTLEMEDPTWGFTYIPVHLEYIMIEILKNSMRANVEAYKKNIMKGEQHQAGILGASMKTDGAGQRGIPAVQVTVALDVDTKDVTIRVRDQGGGIPYGDLGRVFDYSYTTVPHVPVADSQPNMFSMSSEKDVQRGLGGQLAGLGYGLGTARVYAEYFGGSLQLVSLVGWGTDTFIRLKNIYPRLDQEI